MRKAVWWGAAIVAFLATALLVYGVFIEWLEFSERNATKLGAVLSLFAGGGAYELAQKLFPAVETPKS